MVTKINKYYSHGWSIQYDSPLDKYFMDYDLKNFLLQHASIRPSEVLDKKSRRYCYKDYSKKSLPEWDNHREENW